MPFKSSLQVHAGIYFKRGKKERVKVLVLLFPPLPGGNSTPPTLHSHHLSPSTPLLHPANTNTPSSHWKTSVFWGQGRGSTSNLPQSSHMKHLDYSQGKRQEGAGVLQPRWGWGGGLEGSGVRASGWLSLGFKKRPLWVQCAQLHWAVLHTHHPKGNFSQWATILHLTTPLSRSLVMKNKNKALPPKVPPDYLACRGKKGEQMYFHHQNIHECMCCFVFRPADTPLLFTTR